MEMARSKVVAEGNTTEAEASEETNNRYATKKTLTSGLFNFGLLMSNASQLKALVDVGPDGQDYFWPLVVLIGLSILLQVLDGIIMLVLGHLDVDKEKEKPRAKVLNDLTVGFTSAVTVINTFIGGFGIKFSG